MEKYDRLACAFQNMKNTSRYMWLLFGNFDI